MISFTDHEDVSEPIGAGVAGVRRCLGYEQTIDGWLGDRLAHSRTKYPSRLTHGLLRNALAGYRPKSSTLASPTIIQTFTI